MLNKNKLTELAQDVKPFASARLEDLRSLWQRRCTGKVAVLGDASSSMQSAIEAATIFASMVSVCLDGELSFFSSGLVKSPYEKPQTVDETLEVCKQIRANGCTSLAAALLPYYEKKKIVDVFVLVTDEEENTRASNMFFAEMLSLYKKNVNPSVRLIVVCVGKGYVPFRDSLAQYDIDYRVVYIDGARADLAKFDALLGQIALYASNTTLCEIDAAAVVDNDTGHNDVERHRSVTTLYSCKRHFSLS